MEGHEHQASGAEAAEVTRTDIYGEDGAIRSSFLAHIGAAIADRDTLTLKHDVSGLHQSELGDLLEALHPEQRRALVELLGLDFDFSALTEVDEAIRLDIVENLPNDQIAQAVQELDFGRCSLHPRGSGREGPGGNPRPTAVHRTDQAEASA